MFIEMIYALVHYPNIDTRRIDQFRRKYDPQVGLIEPHITAMFPVPESLGEDQLVHHLEKVLDRWRTFPIHLEGLQISWDDYLYLLLQEGNVNIIHLHDQIYTDVLEDYWRKDLPFVPHLTLGILNKDSANRERLLKEAKQLRLNYRCVLDRLHLIKVNDDRSKIAWSKEFLLAK